MQVRDQLVSSCRDLGVEFVYSAAVSGLERAGDGWTCELQDGRAWDADAVRPGV